MTRSKKSRNVAKGVGIVALIAFLIGMYTGLPGFSGGDGIKGDASAGKPQSSGPVAEKDEETKTGLADDVVTVLIDTREYSVLTTADDREQYQPATLNHIATLVRAAKGDANGVRVKVLRKESARVSAERDLRNALVHAGVAESAIYWPNQLVP